MSDAFSPSKRGAEGNPSDDLAGIGWSSDGELTRLQAEHSAEYIALTEAIHTDTQRKILYGLVDGLGEASYRDLERITTVSRRSLRKHVKRLEEKGLVERVNSRSYVIGFTSYETRILAQHIVYCYDEQML